MKARTHGVAALSLGGGDDRLDAHRFSHEAMATVFEVICTHEDGDYAAQAAHAAFLLVDRLEQELSRFIPNSDVSRVNALADGQSTRVSPSAMECLQIALRMYDLTDGVFDISIGTGLETLELVPSRRLVRARGDGVRLDLGGIGKGFALDCVAELLEDWDVGSALVHGGFSSVLAGAPPPGRDGWPLTLTAPGTGESPSRARISARHMALSASGTRKGDHVRDPIGGGAVRSRAAWAILARPEGAQGPGEEWPDLALWPATVAEALSTAFMIWPVGRIAELCRRAPGVEAWLAGEVAGGGLVQVGREPTLGRVAVP